MKNLSSKIVIAFSSMALIGAMYACTNTVAPPEQEETSKVESSSSVDADDESSSSEEEVSSSSEEEEVSSSSEEEVSSSSEEEVVSSSSEDVVEESSSSEEVVVSSSSEDVLPDKVKDKDSVVVVEKEDVGTKVEESELPEDLAEGDSLTGDDLFVKEDDLNFDKNEYYCKTPDGDWYVLEGSKYSSLWARFLNFIAILFTGKSWLDYSKVCDVIYVHPKY
ncbi:MAG: hypothetical protein MJY85_01205 [Fibrobacter sp.]|nr:hypothetical protein [Fibrobacter sp.]